MPKKKKKQTTPPVKVDDAAVNSVNPVDGVAKETPKLDRPGWVDQTVWDSLSGEQQVRLCAGESLEAVRA